jgi:hypothetical protein
MPQPRVSNVRYAWAELVAQPPAPPKHHGTDTSRVRHDFHRSHMRLVLQQAIADGHRIAQCTGHDDAMASGALVRAAVVGGDASMGAIILAMGTGVQRPNRDDEAQAISRGHLTPTPCLGQRQGGLRLDAVGMRAGQGLGPEIVGLHPIAPPPRQRGDSGPHDRFESEMTGFGEQHRAPTEGQVPNPCGACTAVGECMRPPRARVDVKAHRREIDSGEASEDCLAQCQSAGWLIARLEPGKREGITPLHGLETDRCRGREMRRCPLIGRLEFLCQGVECRLRGLVRVQSATDLRPHGFPWLTLESRDPRMAPPLTA